MATTIKDVARVAGVSVATVSRALNGLANVTPQTREHVMSVVAQLRFVPSSAAQSMITRRTHTVGALLPDLHGEYFSELIRGIDLAARSRGLHLLVSSSHGDAAEAAAALRAMNGRVDGLLVMSPHVNADFLWGNVADELPAVLMNTQVANGRHSSFIVDNHGGAYAMVRHLVDAGHRRIAFIAGPERNFEAHERLRGYRAALADCLAGSGEQVLQGDFTQESGHRAGSQVVALTERPTAVFASNDMMAIGCLAALQEAGLQVPQDISLAGFDDVSVSRYVNPSLTTVRARITELGGLALERLASTIEEVARHGSVQPSHQTLRADLVLRHSTAAPALRSTRTD
ncbi:LacI family DNA-binding transcriptional regulator [soil metagenome]